MSIFVLTFGSDSKMSSSEMLSAFSFLNLRMLCLFPLKRSEAIGQVIYTLELLSFTCTKYKPFCSCFGQTVKSGLC